jgi:hypothetical protein
MRSALSVAHRVLVCLAAALSAAGCVSVDGPDTEDLVPVRSGGASVVLFRVVVTSNAGQVSPFDEALESQCMSVGLSDPAQGNSVVPIDGLESFSEAALEDGWLYFVLPAGKHVVAINPPTMYDARGDEKWNDTPHWQFEIPAKTPVVYIGTLRAHCRAESSDFGGVRLREIKAQRLRDDSAAAAAIAAVHLKEFAPPVNVTMERLYQRESTILRGIGN